jgi:hypothetical protein
MSLGQRIRRANVRMVGKLAVVACGMFAFGYALVPMYRAICEMTGINILALSELEVPGGASGGKNVRVPDNTQVDMTRTITVEFDSNVRGGLWDFKPAERTIQVHPGQLNTVDVRVPERAEPPHGRAGHSELRAAAGRAVLQQARVLLLQPVHARPGREEAVAGRVRDRPQDFQGREDHHAVVHLLRGGRQDPRGAGGRGFGHADEPRS